MGFSTWRFWIKLVVLMGFIGLNSVAVYEVRRRVAYRKLVNTVSRVCYR